MDTATLARRLTSRCRYLAYLLIPASKLVDKAKQWGFKERIEENIRLFCPEDQRDEAHLRRLRRDIWYSSIVYNCSPVEYFMFHFERLSHVGRREFLCEYERRRAYDKIAAANPGNNIFGKYDCYQALKEYYKRESFLVDAQADYDAFLAFVQAHPRFIVKPDHAAGGEGVHFDEVSAYDSPRELFDKLRQEAFVLEEPIVQCAEMAKFHPASVNTVRVSTLTDGEKAWVAFGFFKMGRGDSVVDNAAAGGILSTVDVDTGVITSLGITESMKTYLVHPESGEQIVGFQIPRWEEAKAMAVKMAETIPSARGVGWDMALTDDGWVLVEGNKNGPVLVPQLTSQRGMRKDIQPLLDYAATL